MSDKMKKLEDVLNELENPELLFVDYWVAKECKDPHYGMCYKCEKCGRKFANGFMVDDGGTTPDDEE